jgi:hypothetical protein
MKPPLLFEVSADSIGSSSDVSRVSCMYTFMLVATAMCDVCTPSMLVYAQLNDMSYTHTLFTILHTIQEALMPEERILQAFRCDQPHGRCCSAHTASSFMITDQRAIFVKRYTGWRGYKYIHQVTCTTFTNTARVLLFETVFLSEQ